MTHFIQFLFRSSLLSSAVVLAGCVYATVPDPALTTKDAEFLAVVAKADIDPNFHRYRVDDPTGEEPGTIVVDTKSRFLYLVEPGKKAIRYGVAVGSEAFGWTGTAAVGRMAEWPRWPHLAPTLTAGGVDSGPDNPLGARAL